MTDQFQPGSRQSPAVGREMAPRQKRGRLSIFFGMAPGVGKTCAMLQSAQREKLAGRTVVIGYVETHGAKALNALIRGLAQIPCRQAPSGERALDEMDLDAVLAWQPHLVVVDELAHANAPGSRHSKRYHDVLELLEAGIDVYATLSVQNVASRADAVQQITGVTVVETVPDSVLDAAEIELVDLSPVKLIKRLREGMAYLTQNSELARANFFSEGNLMALREMTARLTAERIARDTGNYMEKMHIHGPLKSGHRLLVAVNSSPASEQIVRWTRRLADDLNSPWVALYVETPGPVAKATQTQVRRSLDLAGELGAEVITTTDDDLVRGLLRVASQQNVTQIIIGKPPAPAWRFFQRDSLLRRLVRESGEIDINVVRARDEPQAKPPRRWPILDKSTGAQYLLAAGVVLAVTVAAHFLEPFIGGRQSAALLFLLAVVVLGSFVGRGPTLMAAAMSALLWDFFILPPVFAFRISNFQDGLLLGMYFAVALIMGQLTTRIRAQQEAERLRDGRATALYLLTQELTEAGDLDQIVHGAVRQMERTFKAQIVVFLSDQPDQLRERAHPASTCKPPDEERRTAGWVFKKGQRAGKFTGNLPLAEALYVPLKTSDGIMGVIGLRFRQSFPPTIHQLNLLDAFLQQIGLALDRHRLRAVSERAKLLTESERLSKTLLDSMSHEIRTPIAIIKSATSNLAEIKETDLSGPQQSMIAEIQEATERLNRLVGNVLDITRLESGHVKPRLNECDVSDLVHVAVTDTEKELAHHPVTVEVAAGLPVVPMDFVLMQQALTNLLSNAAHHTPPGTAVRVSARIENESLLLEVADRGPGIEPESLAHIFEKFYRGSRAPTGGTGLGLSLVKGFVEAQGGQVRAKNGAGGGLVFTIRLPVDRIPPGSDETGL